MKLKELLNNSRDEKLLVRLVDGSIYNGNLFEFGKDHIVLSIDTTWVYIKIDSIIAIEYEKYELDQND